MKNILVVEDHPIVGAAIRDMVLSMGYQVAGIADKLEDVIRHMETGSGIDMILMDVQLKDSRVDGIEILEKCRQRDPDIKIIILSGDDGTITIRRALRQPHPADAYLLKNCDMDDIKTAIKRVFQGKKYYSPELSDKIHRIFSGSMDENNYNTLTPKEQEVMRYLVTGIGTGKIAQKLNVSQQTISTHKRNVLEKIGVENVLQLKDYARSMRLID